MAVPFKAVGALTCPRSTDVLTISNNTPPLRAVERLMKRTHVDTKVSGFLWKKSCYVLPYVRRFIPG